MEHLIGVRDPLPHVDTMEPANPVRKGNAERRENTTDGNGSCRGASRHYVWGAVLRGGAKRTKITRNCGRIVGGECIILEDAPRAQRTEDCVKNERSSHNHLSIQLDLYVQPRAQQFRTRSNAECPHCSCPDHEETGLPCKHVFAVRFVEKREAAPDGTVAATKVVTLTKKQDLSAAGLADAQPGAQLREVSLPDPDARSLPQFARASAEQDGTARTPLPTWCFAAF